MRIAEKTLLAIEEACQKDGGASYRMWLKRVLPHIGDAYREDGDEFRSHLGASIIGNDCARAIWYSFRWANKPFFSGRLYRLFNRGHLEEGRLIAALLMIGCKIYQQNEKGEQFRISGAGGHFGGSGDGIIEGCPDLPDGTRALLEFKTSNEKNYKILCAKGVRSAKYEHYVQMNIYMYKMGIPVALYMCVNKNDDEIHAELVTLNKEVALQFIDRAENIIESGTNAIPAKLNDSPGYWKCRFCDHKSICHLAEAPLVNCRTCRHSSPITKDGKWLCNKHNAEIDSQTQRLGCTEYERGF